MERPMRVTVTTAPLHVGKRLSLILDSYVLNKSHVRSSRDPLEIEIMNRLVVFLFAFDLIIFKSSKMKEWIGP